MPRVRLAARFLRPHSSSVSSCVSCQAAAVAPPSTSSSLNACPPPSSRKQIPSFALCALPEDKSFAKLLPTFPYNSTTAVSVNASLQRRSSPIRDAHSDLILGVKRGLTVVGHQRPPRSRCLHSSVVYSNENTNSESYLHDVLKVRPNSSSSKNPFVLDPTLQDFDEEEEETEVVVDREEHFSRDNASAAGDNRRPTTLLYEDEEEEVIIASDSSEEESDLSELGGFAITTSDSSEEESGLSELEEFPKVHSPEDGDDGRLEAEDSRPEEEEYVQWTYSESEGMTVEASTESEGTTEHFSDFSGMVSSVGQDGSHEIGHLTEGENHGDHDNGAPYLHTLSVDEVREILEKARAKDVRILHVKKSCEWVDQLVFASGRSSRHLRGMADAIVYKIKQRSENVGPNSYPLVEGRDTEQWMAIDCGNIVVHLFSEEARSYYNLEEFWTKKSNPRLDVGQLMATWKYACFYVKVEASIAAKHGQQRNQLKTRRERQRS